MLLVRHSQELAAVTGISVQGQGSDGQLMGQRLVSWVSCPHVRNTSPFNFNPVFCAVDDTPCH
jgi:hypothetical protein